MTLQKPLDDDKEKLSVFFNTNTRIVYHSGILDEIFEDLDDNIVSKLVSFSSYGSGWQLLSIDKVTLKLAKYVPVRGSSFIPFHEGHPLRRDSNLLNIHNGSDNNCFLYCYTAGYHLVYKKKNWNRQFRASDLGQMFLHTVERTHQPRCRKETLKCQ